MVPFPSSGLYAGKVTLPLTTVPSGLILRLTYSNTVPAGLTAFSTERRTQSASARTPLDALSHDVVYACIESNENIELSAGPEYSFVLPIGFEFGGAAYYTGIYQNGNWIGGYAGPGALVVDPNALTVSMTGRFGFSIPANGEVCVGLYARETNAPTPTPATSGVLSINSPSLAFTTNAPQTLSPVEKGYSGTIIAISAKPAIATAVVNNETNQIVVTPIAVGTTTIAITAGTQTAKIPVTVTALTPVAIPSGTPSPAPTLTNTPSPNPNPNPTSVGLPAPATPIAIATGSPSPAPTPTHTPSPNPSMSPTPTPTGTPTPATPTAVPTGTPSPAPTPTHAPSPKPSPSPSPKPSLSPTPTPNPSATPAAAYSARESFSGTSTTANAWQYGNDACLTAGSAANPSSSVPACAVASDAPGSGTLQLTSDSGDQTGYVISETAILTAGAGITINFDYFAFALTPAGQSGGDGMSCFLLDASKQRPTSAGAPGSGLGYAPADGKFGISSGYLGVGFDSFGNFSVGGPATDPAGGSALRVPETVAVRGAESTKYAYIGGYTAPSGAASRLPFNLDSGTTGMRPASALHVKLIVNSQRITITIGATTFTLPFPAGSQQLFPAKVYVGFAASTGNSTDVHQIRNVTINAPQ